MKKHKNNSRPLLLWASLLSLLLGLPAQAGETLSIEQALEHALKHSPRLESADLEIQAAEARRKQARGQFGPKLQFELSAAKFDAAPGMGGSSMSEEELAGLQMLAGADPFDNVMVDVFQSLPDMFAGEAYNVDITARVVQPLTPLWAIYQGYKLSELGVALARVVKIRQADELRYQVQQSYLQALQADAGVLALAKAIETVQAHVEQARHFVEAELISKVELLQAQVRLFELKGQLATSKNGASLARAQLSMLMDWPTDKPLPDLKIPTAPQPAGRPALEQVQKQARDHRPEFAELGIRSQQAERGVKARWQGYMPQLVLVGSFQHNEGSIMAPPTWIGAAVLNWDVWEWGVSHYKVEEAEVMLSKVQKAKEELRRGIALQVHAAWLKLAEAAERIDIAKNGMGHAEEHLRMEQERFAAQQSTSTEVLDAQMRLTQAQVEQENANYEYLMAEAALRKATGEKR